MAGLFRFKGDDSRWKFFCVTGLGVIAITYLPSIAAKRADGNSKNSTDPPITTPQRRLPQDSINRQIRDRATPSMTAQQIEQARSTLIHQGFSPMHADTILPTNATP